MDQELDSDVLEPGRPETPMAPETPAAPESAVDESAVPEVAEPADEPVVAEPADEPVVAGTLENPEPAPLDPAVERQIAREVAVGVRRIVVEPTLEQQASDEEAAASSQAAGAVVRPAVQTGGYVPRYPAEAQHLSQPVGSFQQGSGRQYAYAAPRPTIETSQSRTGSRRRRGGGLKSFVFGLLGGLAGAALMVAALTWAGVIGKESTVIQTTAPAQTVQITTAEEDITVAQAVAAKALPSVVLVNCTYDSGAGLGSGVILDADGNIITNYHVVEGANTITVTAGSLTFDAEVVGSDPSSDLAVIKADFGDFEATPIEVGDSSELVVGDWVMTVGSPFGLEQSVSAGIVSSLYRSELMQSESGMTIYANLIQVDAAINPGNSGGALVNSQGQLVGICTLFSSDTQSFAGIGFAIPGNYAIDIANRIIAGEQVTHAYIGLSMQTVNAQNAEANGLSVSYGAYVAEVMEDGPAETAGIQVGDIVIAVGGKRVTSADSMVLEVRSHSIGETVTVTVVRGEEQLDVDVTLGSDERLQELQAEQREQQREQERTDEKKNPDGIPNSGN